MADTNNKKITVDQMKEISADMATKNDARFAKKTDVYTKTEIDGKLSSTYKASGNKSAAELTSALLIAENEGKVYNASDAVTSTADFTGEVGKVYPAGTNFVVIEATPADDSDPENPVEATYKFDALAGFVDLSNYATLEDVEVASAADITAICNGYYGE